MLKNGIGNPAGTDALGCDAAGEREAAAKSALT
jgi:hypothetical protein